MVYIVMFFLAMFSQSVSSFLRSSPPFFGSGPVYKDVVIVSHQDDSSAPVQLSNALPFLSSPLKKARYVMTWYPTNCFWLG